MACCVCAEVRACVARVKSPCAALSWPRSDVLERDWALRVEEERRKWGEAVAVAAVGAGVQGLSALPCSGSSCRGTSGMGSVETWRWRCSPWRMASELSLYTAMGSPRTVAAAARCGVRTYPLRPRG